MAITESRTDGPPPTWLAVFAGISVSALAALGLYAATVALLIGPYILRGSEVGRVAGVYRSYQTIKAEHSIPGPRPDLVLFWGSSMIREAVDASLVETNAPMVAAYNLAVSGDLPLRRLTELAQVRKLRPTRVVIGVSYADLFDKRSPYEDQIAILPAETYAQIPPEAQGLLTAQFREAINKNRFWWKRKFFFSAVFWSLGIPDRSSPVPPGYATDLKAPWVYHQSLKASELQRFLAERGYHYPPYSDNHKVELNDLPSARSFQFLVHELQIQGTQVVLVNMPLHPLLNAVVPAERRRCLRSYLQSLVSPFVTVIDFQDRLSADQFIDLVHVNAKGRSVFTQAIGEYLAKPQLASKQAFSRGAESTSQDSTNAF